MTDNTTPGSNVALPAVEACGLTQPASFLSTTCRTQHTCVAPKRAHTGMHQCRCGHTWAPRASYHNNHPFR